MDVDEAKGMTEQLDDIAGISNQKDRTSAYLTLLQTLLTSTPPPSGPLITFGTHFTTSTSTALVVGRRVLSLFVLLLCGNELDTKEISFASGEGEDGGGGDSVEWTERGVIAFAGEEGAERREEVVVGVLEKGGSGWCEEQVTVLRKLHSHILQEQEDWLGAARALMQIPLEGGSRLVSAEEKLKTYVQIVRLLLECGESGQAQTYYSRASHISDSTQDKATLLAYKLCQARLADFSARFNEAAQRYHELSFDTSIDEDDRLQMLKAAVTTSILAPAGPQRSRILATLTRDERVAAALPSHLDSMLRKMLLDYIVRPAEMQEFEAGLADHQRATVEGGGTVLERAVREHNVGACAKVYDNVSFEALGAILGLDSDRAEGVARKMIEQGRLRAWIDQPLHLLYFESRSTDDRDAEAEGTAGGLGIEREEKQIEPVSWMERWDDRIRDVGNKVEALAAAIQAKTAISTAPAGPSVSASV